MLVPLITADVTGTLAGPSLVEHDHGWRSELRIDKHDDRTRPHVEAELFSRQVGRLLAACLSGISAGRPERKSP